MKNRNLNTQIRDELFADLHYVLTNHYHQSLSRKIKAALAAARASGVRLGRPPKKKQGEVKKAS